MISIIIPCKGRLVHLKQSLPSILIQKDCEIIIIDYSCPDDTLHWFTENIKKGNAKCYRKEVEMEEWNLSASRNYGFTKSNGQILFFLDADVFLNEHFVEDCLKILEPGSFICGWGSPDATGCCMIFRTDFLLINGYNENMTGWGFEDIDLYNRLENAGLKKKIWPEGISSIKHSDEDRVRFQKEKDLNKTNIANAQQKNFKGLCG